MQNLLLQARFFLRAQLAFEAPSQSPLLPQEGDIVQLKSTSLPKANFVKLRPQSKDFLDISNPRAVLEKTLRAYTCLTTGDSILINYNNKRFYLDIMETKPGPAVSVFEVLPEPFTVVRGREAARFGAAALPTLQFSPAD